jgi:hypothetical protein
MAHAILPLLPGDVLTLIAGTVIPVTNTRSIAVPVLPMAATTVPVMASAAVFSSTKAFGIYTRMLFPVVLENRTGTRPNAPQLQIQIVIVSLKIRYTRPWPGVIASSMLSRCGDRILPDMAYMCESMMLEWTGIMTNLKDALITITRVRPCHRTNFHHIHINIHTHSKTMEQQPHPLSPREPTMISVPSELRPMSH